MSLCHSVNGIQFSGRIFYFFCLFNCQTVSKSAFFTLRKGGNDLGPLMDKWVYKICFRHTIKCPQTVNKIFEMAQDKGTLKMLTEINQSQTRNAI